MFLTIFTPAYNRRHLLPRLYNSLCSQQFRDFEWLVVDDGSTDGTAELISQYITENKIRISHVGKENGGKHTAHNIALQHARGEYFFTVDSDDWLPADALDRLKRLIDCKKSILERDNLAGIIALKSYQDGDIIGRPFSKENFTTTLYDLEHSGNNGERSIIFKTAIIKPYPFPIISGERFMPESVIYDRIGQAHSFFISNENFTVCEYQPEGLSSNPRRLMYNNPGALAIYFIQRLNLSQSLKETIRYAIQAYCFTCLYKGGIPSVKVKRHRVLYQLLKPLGRLATLHYRRFA